MVPEAIVIAQKPKQTNGVHVNGVDHVGTDAAQSGQKRKRDSDVLEAEDENVRKRGKVHEAVGGEAITVGDEDGAIVLD